MFHAFFYQPLFNALVFLYQTAAFNDLGIAIVILTIVIRLVLYPLFYKSYKNQTLLQKIQPLVKKIQHDHKGNREKQAQALLALYKEHRINPFSSFILIAVQLPILFALFRVFRSGVTPEALVDLYDFIAKPAFINHSFLGLLDLAKPNIIIVGLAALAQYFQARLAIPKQPKNNAFTPQERVSRQMVFIGPVLTLTLYYLPAALGLYWLVTSVFSLIQQIFVNRSLAREKIFHHGDTDDTNQKNT